MPKVKYIASPTECLPDASCYASTLCCLRVRTTELHVSRLGKRLGVGDGVRIQMKFYSGTFRSKVRRSDCASAALSKMCGATPRFSSASPSFKRRKPLVV